MFPVTIELTELQVPELLLLFSYVPSLHPVRHIHLDITEGIGPSSLIDPAKTNGILFLMHVYTRHY